jgi:hypothetical protein
MTRRLLLLLCLCPLLCAAASAYIVTIDAPHTLTAGEPLIVNGTSTLPPGYTHDIIIYGGSAELARTTIVVQQGGTFTARFDTTGFATGDYKVELVPPADPGFFGSSSVTSRLVAIVDRSREVTVTSPAAQSDVQNLTVAGTAPGKPSSSIAIGVTGPGNYTFGPEYVRTDANGSFAKSVPIQGAGSYQVTLSDPAGVIMRYTVTVTGEPRVNSSATVPPIPSTFTTPASGIATATPLSTTMAATTPTRSGLSPLAALGAGLLLLVFMQRR